MGRLSPNYDRAMHTLVIDLKRSRDWNTARGLWSELQTSPDPLERYWAWIEESKFAEHRIKDIALAMSATAEAANALLKLSESPTHRMLRAQLKHRRNRLEMRLNTG